LQFEALKVLIVVELPEQYLHKKHLPNQKQQKLTKAKDTLFSQLQAHEKPFIERMLNTLLAMNYSASTIENYGSCFLEYLRYFDQKKPEDISNTDIIKFLGTLMQQGLSASKGHMMVNAVQFYYH
jgi:integrase/recombinase XerD